MHCIGGLGSREHSSGGILSMSVIYLDRLTVCLESSWTSITSRRLPVRRCTGGLPIDHSGLNLGIVDISGLSIGSITFLPTCLGVCAYPGVVWMEESL